LTQDWLHSSELTCPSWSRRNIYRMRNISFLLDNFSASWAP
jgi:hypothetical protein